MDANMKKKGFGFKGNIMVNRKMNLSNKPRFSAVMRPIWLIVFLCVPSLFISIQAWAGEVFNHTLLVTPHSSILKQIDTKIESGPEVVRSRIVTINFGPLTVMDGLEVDNSDNRLLLKLDLFEDVSVTAVVIKTKSASRDSLSWIGHLEDDPESQVSLVKNNDILQGNINSYEGVFQIRYVTHINGIAIHAVREIDPSQFPPDHPPGLESGALHSDEFLSERDRGLAYGGLNSDVSDQDGDVAGDDGSVIDVMVVYTPAARSAVGGTAAMNTLIDLAVTETNQGYSNSGILPTMNLVYKVEVSYTESGSFSTDLDRLEGKADGYMDNVHTLRDTYNADMVGLLTNDSAYCGLASTIMATEAQAFQVTYWDCATGYYSFAHEFGHLQGARHDWRVDSTDNSPFSYNHGYVNTGMSWRTVMAYNDPACSGGNCTRLLYWSNPDITYGGLPLGVPEGAYHAADNRKTINNTAHTVANFRTGSGATPSITSPTPGSTLSGSSQTFYWAANGVSVTEWWLYIGTSTGLDDIYDSGSLGTATSHTVNGLPTNGSTLHVRLWYMTATKWYYEDYTYTAASSASSGFNSQFNGDATGWWQLSATAPWSISSDSFYYTEGAAGEFTSTYYGSYVDSTTMYGDFDYQASFWRNGSDTSSTGLLFRGNPSPPGSGYCWNHGYGFYCTRNGSFAIFKFTDGSSSTLLPWTASSAINQGSSWNTLRVSASGTTVYFYINGTHVATLTNASYTNGKAGLTMYRDTSSSDNALWVDWATLITSSDFDPPIEGEVEIIDEAALSQVRGQADSGVGEQPTSINAANTDEVEAQ